MSNAVTNSVRNAVVTLYARSTRPRPVPSFKELPTTDPSCARYPHAQGRARARRRHNNPGLPRNVGRSVGDQHD